MEHNFYWRFWPLICSEVEKWNCLRLVPLLTLGKNPYQYFRMETLYIEKGVVLLTFLLKTKFRKTKKNVSPGVDQRKFSKRDRRRSEYLSTYTRRLPKHRGIKGITVEGHNLWFRIKLKYRSFTSVTIFFYYNELFTHRSHNDTVKYLYWLCMKMINNVKLGLCR